MRAIWPKGGLWRHSDFLKLWSAETISQVGSQVTGLGPAARRHHHARRQRVRGRAAGRVEFAPFILISLPAGVWVDRLPRRPILIVGDLGRAVLLATIPIAYAVDALTMWQLYVVGFCLRRADGVLRRRVQSYLPALVVARPAHRRQLEARDLALRRPARRARRSRACSSRCSRRRWPSSLDAMSFVVSGLFVLAIRKREDLCRDREAGPFSARTACGRSCPKDCATCSGTGTCAGSLPRRRRSTSSAT